MFVLGFDWGVEVAVATALAEWTGLGLACGSAAPPSPPRPGRDRARVFHRATLGRMLEGQRRHHDPSALLQATFVSFLFLGACFGDVAGRQPGAAAIPDDHGLRRTALPSALRAFVGRALGARDRAAAACGGDDEPLGLCDRGGAGSSGLSRRRGWLIDVMTTAPEVRAPPRGLLGWMVAAPILGGAASRLDGIFIGATATRDMRNMMILSAAVYIGAVASAADDGQPRAWAALLVSFVAWGSPSACAIHGAEAGATPGAERTRIARAVVGRSGPAAGRAEPGRSGRGR
ncbi:MAG: hypothetical protein R3D80_20865 [Paracoccaceae bacterium]